MTLTATAFDVYNSITRELTRGTDFKWFGGQVLWVWRNGVLTKRFIAGTGVLSQHAGGNAFDIGPLNVGSASDIAKIDRAVEIARAHPSCGRILWRGVRNHYPHHAHIEGKPALTQAQLWSYYENSEEDMTVAELVEELQQGLVDAGYDLGDYGPANNGVDGDWGAKSATAYTEMCRDAKSNNSGLVEHRHSVELPDSFLTSNPF